jgi:hypothetical protein
MRFGQIIALLAAGCTVSAAPLESRAVIAHDAVVGFAQAVPSGAIGMDYPWLFFPVSVSNHSRCTHPFILRKSFPNMYMLTSDYRIGNAYLRFKPWLYVDGGCVPFPAVDAAGNTGGGLAPTGSPTGDCSSSTGQVYVRGAQYGSRYGIMYSWYVQFVLVS